MVIHEQPTFCGNQYMLSVARVTLASDLQAAHSYDSNHSGTLAFTALAILQPALEDGSYFLGQSTFIIWASKTVWLPRVTRGPYGHK